MRAHYASHSSFVVLGAIVLSGCAITDYKKPIDSLHESLASTVSTVEKLDRQMTNVQNDRWRAQIEKGKLLLSTVDGSCASGAQGCSLQIESTDPRFTPRSFPATTLMPKARIALQALRTYAAGLKAISDADTASKVTASANETLGNLANIEKTIAMADGEKSDTSRIEEFREPAIAAIEWVVTRYVERVKVKALATATKRAQPVMKKLSTWYTTVGMAASSLALADESEEFIKQQKAFDVTSTPSAVAIDRYVGAVSDFDVALKASSANPLNSFLDAHTKLKKQLNNEGDVTLADAIAAIELLADDVKAFKAIVDKFDKVLEQ